jgi:hypothetical protein
MDRKLKFNVFFVLLGSALMLACSYVPYVRVIHHNNRTFSNHEGFGFIGTLLHNQMVNIPFLVTELGIILLFAGFYYLILLKDKD